MMRCDHCTADAVVINPGTDEVRNLFLLSVPTPDRFWCLPHAIAAGWPWLASETRHRTAIRLGKDCTSHGPARRQPADFNEAEPDCVAKIIAAEAQRKKRGRA